MTPHQQIRLSAKRQALACLHRCLEHKDVMPIDMLRDFIGQIEVKTKELEIMEADFNA